MVAAVIRDSSPDITGTDDGLAKAPDIRESRRIRAELAVTEMHAGQEARRADQAANFPDSIGVSCYGLTFIRVRVRTTTSTLVLCPSRFRWGL